MRRLVRIFTGTTTFLLCLLSISADAASDQNETRRGSPGEPPSVVMRSASDLIGPPKPSFWRYVPLNSLTIGDIFSTSETKKEGGGSGTTETEGNNKNGTGWATSSTGNDQGGTVGVNPSSQQWWSFLSSKEQQKKNKKKHKNCLLYTSPSPRD